MQRFIVMLNDGASIPVMCEYAVLSKGVFIGEVESKIIRLCDIQVVRQTVAYIPTAIGFYIDGDLANVQGGFIPKGDL